MTVVRDRKICPLREPIRLQDSEDTARSRTELVLINRAGDLYGRILIEVASTDRTRSEVCTSDRGQDSPIQADLARLIRCLLYGQTRNQKDKKKLFPCAGSSI